MGQESHGIESAIIGRRSLVGSAMGLTVLALPTAHVSASGVQGLDDPPPNGGEDTLEIESVSTTPSDGESGTVEVTFATTGG